MRLSLLVTSSRDAATNDTDTPDFRLSTTIHPSAPRSNVSTDCEPHPRAARFDIEGFDAFLIESSLKVPINELRAVITSDILGCAMLPDRPSHHLLDFPGVDGAVDMDTPVLPCRLIQNGQHPQYAATYG